MQKLRGLSDGPKESDIIYKPANVSKVDFLHRISYYCCYNYYLGPAYIKDKFSIVLVDFNETFLAKTVESILLNSTKELLGEILVIDDGTPIPVRYDHPLVRIVRNGIINYNFFLYRCKNWFNPS